MDCSYCARRAVYTARYNGRHYCAKHFSSFVEVRVKREIREQRILERGLTAVAVSGGKDSMTALHLLSTLASQRRMSVVALTVDEGIRGYRDASMRVVEQYCTERAIDWRHDSFASELKMTMDELSSLPRARTTCAYCGVVRRQLLNRLARDAGADRVATGLNLDDTAQSVLMNIARSDVARLGMMGPHHWVIDGLIPRVQPLRLIPESEVLLYATLNGIPFVRSSCPHSEEASRNLFREIVLRMEQEMPGARYSILKSASKMHVTATGPGAGRCERCGDVASGAVCRSCQLKDEIALLAARAS